jgi:hypothetical protein
MTPKREFGIFSSIQYCRMAPRLDVGCPRNNQICFWVEPKQTETQSVSVGFRFALRNQKHFFRFVLVFRTGIETTKTNRILSKQTEKISKKHSLLGGP